MSAGEGYPPSSHESSRSLLAHGRARASTLDSLAEDPIGSLEADVEVGSPHHEHEDTVTLFVAVLVGVSALSGLLFGYDTASISGALVNIRSDLGEPLSTGQKVCPLASLEAVGQFE